MRSMMKIYKYDFNQLTVLCGSHIAGLLLHYCHILFVFRSPATSATRGTLAAMHAWFHKMKYFYLIVLFSFCCYFGCAHSPNPGISIEKVKFSIFPYISERDGNYFLRYQLDTTDSTNLPLVRVVYTHNSNGKAYYYFSIPISHYERGKIVERPLASDGFEEYAKLNSIYWLNDNKNEVKLKILKEHHEVK
jgi:hypothetical protein